MNLEDIKSFTEFYISSLTYDEEDEQRRLKGLSKADTLSQCVSVINKGNRFDYLNWLHKESLITDQECADIVYYIWTIQEFFHNCGMSKTKMIKFMKLAQKSPLLQSDIDDLSDTDMVTIYRGVNVDDHRGLSWTIDRSVAEWFAKRFGHNGDKCYVFTGKIRKEDIITIFKSRNENEVVCNYRKIKNIQCEEIIIDDSPESKFDKHIKDTVMM